MYHIHCYKRLKIIAESIMFPKSMVVDLLCVTIIVSCDDDNLDVRQTASGEIVRID